MASIRKRGNTYQITVSNGRDINGKKITETTTFTPDETKTEKQNQKALEKFAYEFEEKVKSGRYLSGEKLTYSEFIEIWKREYAEKQLEVTSLERADIAFKTIMPQIGHIKLAALLPLHIQTFYSSLQKDGYIINGKRKEYSNNTIKRIHAVISGTLNVAVMWGLVENNPCSRVKPPKVTKNPSDIKHFTLDEAITFLSLLEQEYTVIHKGRQKKDGTGSAEHVEAHTIPTQFKAFFNIALFGGLRRGELIALQWNDIDFKSNSVAVTKSTAKTKNGQITKTPKTLSSNRVVSLPPSVMQLLKKYRAEQNALRLSLGSYWQGDNYLFIQSDGRQMDIDTPNHTFKKIINRYNEIAENKLPDISIHGLRHTAATLMISQNIDVRTVAGRLGHSETSTTLNIYAHSLKEMDEKAGNILESILIQKKA